MYTVIVIADENDADYITEKTLLEDDEYEKLLRILPRINSKLTYNWCTNGDGTMEYFRTMYKGILSEDEIEFIDDIVPFGMGGVHTIESIVSYPSVQETKIF